MDATDDTRLTEMELEELNVKFQNYLEVNGFEWFLEHDCAPEIMKREILDPDMNYTHGQAKQLLSKERTRIESSVHRMHLKEDSKSKSALRCVLLGKTGEGKSSLGNLLIGQKSFGIGHDAKSETHTIQYGNSDDLEIIDTPGLGDPNKKVDVIHELTKIFETFKEGIHTFIYVFSISNPRVTEADVEIFRKIKNMFRDKMKSHTILVLTNCEERLSKRNLNEYVDGMKGSAFGEIFDLVGNQVIAVENSSTGYKRELHKQGVVNMIREMIQNAIAKGDGECYTPTFFDKAKSDLEDENNKRRVKQEADELAIVQMVSGQIERQLSNANEDELLELNGSDTEQDTEQDSLLEKLLVSVDPNEKEYARKEGRQILKKQIDSKLHDTAKQIVITVVNDCNMSEDQYFEEIQSGHSRLVQVVSKSSIKNVIGMRQRELSEKKAIEDREAKIAKMEKNEAQVERERQAREAESMREMKATIKKYVTQNIVLHDRIGQIVRGLPENDRYDKQKTHDMVQEFLWSAEGSALVDKHVKLERKRLRKESISAMEHHMKVSLRKFLSEKTRAQMNEYKTNEETRLGIIELIVNELRENLSQRDLSFLSDNEIKQTVMDSFNQSINSVTNSGIMEKISMTFSFLFGEQHTKDLMEKFDMFGDRMKSHTILVLTHSEEQLSKHSLKEFIVDMKGSEFGRLFDIIGNQAIAVDNLSTGYKRELQKQGVVNMIREMIQNAIAKGHGECYTPAFFDEAKSELEEKRKHRREKQEADELAIDKMVSDLINGKLSDANIDELFELNYSKEKQDYLVEKVIVLVKHENMEYARKRAKKTLTQQLASKLFMLSVQRHMQHIARMMNNIFKE